jgi:hypothetical protein
MENLDPAEIGWCAGIIDGEGSVVLVQNKGMGKRKADDNFGISPRVLMSVTDFKIIQKYTTILTKWGVEYGYTLQGPYLNDHRNVVSHASRLCVHICKQASLIRFLEIVRPHLSLKADLADLVLEFTKFRMSMRQNFSHRYSTSDFEAFAKEQEYWTKYRETYVTKARSTFRDLKESIRTKSVPLHWPD